MLNYDAIIYEVNIQIKIANITFQLFLFLFDRDSCSLICTVSSACRPCMDIIEIKRKHSLYWQFKLIKAKKVSFRCKNTRFYTLIWKFSVISSVHQIYLENKVVSVKRLSIELYFSWLVIIKKTYTFLLKNFVQMKIHSNIIFETY